MSLDPNLQRAIHRLRIADVTLKAIDAGLVDDFIPEMSDEVNSLSTQTIAPVCRTITSFDGQDLLSRRSIFEMYAGLRLLRPAEHGYSQLTADEVESLVCAKVECYFLVSYDEEKAGGEFLDDDSLSLYAQHNVPFNMWPYWREVVQSACSRMGLPRVVLPTHRLSRAATTSRVADTKRVDVSR